MFLPTWVLAIIGIYILGAVINGLVMLSHIPRDNDHFSLTYEFWAIAVMSIFIASITWYLWIWFWLWDKLREKVDYLADE